MTDRREVLVDQRRAVANRAQWRLHELDPTLAVTAVSFNYATHRDPLIGLLDNISGLVAEFAQDELREIAALTATINSLTKRITTEIHGYAPNLLALDVCGVLTAAKIAGEGGNVTRFKSEAALARYIGSLRFHMLPDQLLVILVRPAQVIATSTPHDIASH